MVGMEEGSPRIGVRAGIVHSQVSVFPVEPTGYLTRRSKLERSTRIHAERVNLHNNKTSPDGSMPFLGLAFIVNVGSQIRSFFP